MKRDNIGRFVIGSEGYWTGTKGLKKPNSGSFKPGGKPWNKNRTYKMNVNRKGIRLNTGRTHFKPGDNSGEKHWNWKGGINPLIIRIRRCRKYTDWVKAVFERDSYTCRFCATKKSPFNADHIKLFSDIMREYKVTTFEDALACDELWDIENGRTLCEPCHQERHEG